MFPKIFSYAVSIILVIHLWVPLSVLAASPSIVISELQTGGSTASYEFVELYNPTASNVIMEGWNLEYKSAAGTTWSRRASLNGTIRSYGYFLIAPDSYLPTADADMSSGLSGTGGHIRITDSTGNTVDLVGWGSAAAAETAPAVAPSSGQSIERLAGRLAEDGGNAIDTDDNSKDFILRSEPQPQSTTSLAETPFAGQLADEDDGESPAPQAYPGILLNELLPDPASPQTDAKDEFIELFNPTSQEVSLKGYSLHTGSKFYVFNSQTIPAGGYLVVYSATTKLALVNAGSIINLQDPAGKLLDEAAYEDAPTGASWAKFGGWSWTTKPTPGSNNHNEPATQETKPKSAAAAKSTTKSAAKVKASTAKSAAAKAEPNDHNAQTATDSPLGRWLLIGLAGFTIMYAIYEYRYDLRNYIQLARKHLQARRAAR